MSCLRRGLGIGAISLLAVFTVAGQPQAGAAFPEAPGEPLAVAVLPLGLSERTRQIYPQLAEHNVGLGIHNMMVEHLHASGWFQLVEDKPEIVEDLLNRQWVSSTGAVSPESAVRIGRLRGARYVLYGEVYDFSVLQIRKRQWETSIAIQIRLVDVETSTFVPATGRDTSPHRARGSVNEVAVARSTVGRVSEKALRQAVVRLLKNAREQLFHMEVE